MLNGYRRDAAWLLLVLLVAGAHFSLPAFVAALAPSLDAKQSRSSPIRLITARPSPPSPQTSSRPVSANQREPNTAPRSIAAPRHSKSVANTASSPDRKPLNAAARLESDSLPAPSTPDEAASMKEPGSSSVVNGLPESGYLEYSLTGRYNNEEVSGSGRVTWNVSAPRYRLTLELTASHRFTAVFAQSMASDGSITSNGLRPSRFEAETLINGQEPRHFSALFDENPLGGGQLGDSHADTQDPLSLAFQLGQVLRRQPKLTTPGSMIELPVTLPGAILLDGFVVQESQTLFSPFGEIQAIRLTSRQAADPGVSWRIDTWIAPDFQYAPARVQISRGTDISFDLAISRRPDPGP